MPFDMSPTPEERIRAEAERHGIAIEASLNRFLENTGQATKEETAGIQQGLADVVAGRTRRFADFLAEHKKQYPHLSEEAD